MSRLCEVEPEISQKNNISWLFANLRNEYTLVYRLESLLGRIFHERWR